MKVKLKFDTLETPNFYLECLAVFSILAAEQLQREPCYSYYIFNQKPPVARQ